MTIIKQLDSAEKFLEVKNQILNEFGKDVELLHLFVVSENLKSGVSFEQFSQHMHVPFRVEGQIVLMAKVNNTTELSVEDKGAIAELLQNGFLATWSEVESQKRPLHFLIEGGFEARCQRITEMIHEQLDNWAHLRWSSLMNAIENMADLKTLGSVTISFDTFENLNEGKWVELQNLIQDPEFEGTIVFYNQPLVSLNLCVVPVLSLPAYDYDLHQTLELLLDKSAFLNAK